MIKPVNTETSRTVMLYPSVIMSQRRSPILAEKSRIDFKLSLFVLRGTINHVTLLTSILACQRFLKIFGNVFYLLHRYQFYRIVFIVLFWFRWYQWYFCGISGCEDTNRNVCLYTSFSEGIALPCATSLKHFKGVIPPPHLLPSLVNKVTPRKVKSWISYW